MNGRIYRLRRKKRVNSFDPAAYEAAAKHIDSVAKYDLVQTVEVTTDDTSINPYLREVLVFNGYTIGNTNTTKKKIKYTIKDRNQRENALALLQKMKNDRINDVDFSGSTPVGISVSGVRVPLTGYTKNQAESGDKGITTIGASSTETTEIEEGASANWLLIAGVSVVGIVVLLAVIKMFKK